MNSTYFILSIIWIVILVGIGLEGYFFYQSPTISKHSQHNLVPVGRKLVKQLVKPLWPIWVLLCLCVVMGPTILNSYYGFFATEINRQLLIMTSLNGFFLVSIFIFLPYRDRSSGDKSLAYLIVGTFLFLSLFALGFTLPRASQQLQALFSDPITNTGIVHNKYQDYVVRTGTVHYVFIEDFEFKTIDARWYDTIQVGESLTYIYSPFDKSWHPHIFDPQKSNLTLLGGFVFLCGFLIWVLIICFAVEGWLTILSKPKLHKNKAI